MIQQHFFRLTELIGNSTRNGEGFLARYSGEHSRFVRFNRAAIRQAGAVMQAYLDIELFHGHKHVSVRLALTGANEDEQRVASTLAELRQMLAAAPEDPHFLVNTAVSSTSRCDSDRLPDSETLIPAILNAVAGADFVGFYAAGPIHHGFANSYGQRNWSTVSSFSLDGCFYAHTDKAVKISYGGTQWDDGEFARKTAAAKSQLRLLERPPQTVPPGGYRVFLAPAAMEAIIGMLGWGGFSLAAHRTATTPLIRLARGDVSLNQMVTLTEHAAAGLAPKFQDEGFVKPDAIPLIANGRYRECLVSPRSAAEFGVAQNGANAAEAPAALDMAPGTLPESNVLTALGTGLLVGNLWYLNYSDRNACRLTGMTRFATFWVENGEIAAPVNVMRFDDSVYRLLGPNLIALTEQRDWRLSTDTYEARSSVSMHLPGALIEDFRLTL